jgi:hypothetical protein
MTTNVHCTVLPFTQSTNAPAEGRPRTKLPENATTSSRPLPFTSRETRRLREALRRYGQWTLQQHEINRRRRATTMQREPSLPPSCQPDKHAPPASTPRPPASGGGRALFTSVTRRSDSHPLVRITRACGRGANRMMGGLETALLVYFSSLGLTAFPLIAHAHWIGGITMVTVGSGFGRLLIHRVHSSMTGQ